MNPNYAEPNTEPAIKKIYRWQVAVKAWQQMTHNIEADILCKYLAQTLSIGQFSLDSLLFYFRYDSMSPHGIKKNSKNITFNKFLGHSVLTKSAQFEKTQSELIGALTLQARTQQIREPFQGRLWLMAHFYIPESRYYTKSGQVSETIPDLTNLLELPQDCMQQPRIAKSGKKTGKIVRKGAGIITNDSHIDSTDGSRRLPWDQESYRLELFLMRYPGHNGKPSR